MNEKEQLGVELLTETGKKSRGGLKEYSEARAGTVQRVRGDFLSPVFKPRITFAFDSITFNMSCVNLFPGDQYVVVGMDGDHLRVIIEPCMPYDRDSLKFANRKNDRNEPRKCMTRIFCNMVYTFMNWNREAKYRCMAIFQEFDDHKLMVFNLDECSQVITETVESADGTKKRNTTINMPPEWQGRFGYTPEELDAKNRLDTTSTFITVDNKSGERRHAQIIAKLPTPEELIHRPYGGIRTRQEAEEDD